MANLWLPAVQLKFVIKTIGILYMRLARGWKYECKVVKMTDCPISTKGNG